MGTGIPWEWELKFECAWECNGNGTRLEWKYLIYRWFQKISVYLLDDIMPHTVSLQSPRSVHGLYINLNRYNRILWKFGVAERKLA